MTFNLRKIVSYSEEVLVEGGRAGAGGRTVRLTAVAAVLDNPWKGRGFVDDLQPEILAIAPPLAGRLVPELLRISGGADLIEAYGKSAVVGLNGEIEHASALIHTLRFGNIFRAAAKGKSYLSFCNTRGPANAAISMPLIHKTESGTRSHFLTVQFSIPDAPGPDELVVAIGASTGPRLHARIGDRYEDMKEMTNAKEMTSASA